MRMEEAWGIPHSLESAQAEKMKSASPEREAYSMGVARPKIEEVSEEEANKIKATT